jgi:hypothetical protein
MAARAIATASERPTSAWLRDGRDSVGARAGDASGGVCTVVVGADVCGVVCISVCSTIVYSTLVYCTLAFIAFVVEIPGEFLEIPDPRGLIFYRKRKGNTLVLSSMKFPTQS